MSKYRIVSSDDHVYEPANLWDGRIESRFADRAPRIARMDDGGDWWVCDDTRMNPVTSGSQAGTRFKAPELLSAIDTFDKVRPGGYIPEEHIKDMDLDGIDVSVLYPTAGIALYRVSDSELLTAVLRGYNDWLGEFCGAFPERLKAIAMLNMDDTESGVRELERCARMGFVGAMMSVYPQPGKRYGSPTYEPLWAAAQDLGMPLSLHIGTQRPGPEFDTTEAPQPSSSCNVDHWVRKSLADMIFSGVFARYPGLQVGSVEHEVSWAAHFLDRLDYTYTQRIHRPGWHELEDGMLPSDYFHRNVFIGFQEDGLGIRLRDVIGVESLLWGSDYPHQESTFPRSMEILEDILADCTEEEKAKISGGNAARVYRLN